MSEALACANHPDRETRLRCNRCGKPICLQCAVQTPVGYRCRECVRGQQAAFETASKADHLVAGGVSAVAVGLATVALAFLSLWGLLAAPVVGGGVAEIVRWAVRRRRGRRLPMAAVVGGVIGLVPHLVVPLGTAVTVVAAGADLLVLGAATAAGLHPLAIGALMIGSLYYRLRGIRL